MCACNSLCTIVFLISLWGNGPFYLPFHLCRWSKLEYKTWLVWIIQIKFLQRPEILCTPLLLVPLNKCILNWKIKKVRGGYFIECGGKKLCECFGSKYNAAERTILKEIASSRLLILSTFVLNCARFENTYSNYMIFWRIQNTKLTFPIIVWANEKLPNCQV